MLRFCTESSKHWKAPSFALLKQLHLFLFSSLLVPTPIPTHICSSMDVKSIQREFGVSAGRFAPRLMMYEVQPTLQRAQGKALGNSQNLLLIRIESRCLKINRAK